MTLRYRCDALTNWTMKPLTMGAGHLWVLMSPWRMDVKWYMKCFIYWTPLKSWLFQASIRNCLNCVHNFDDHGLLGLSTSVHVKPIDSYNCLLHSSSHPQHIKNVISPSQFLRLMRICSDDSDFNNKCKEISQFFKKRCSTDSAVTTGKHRAQEIDRETALQTSQNEKANRVPFTPPSNQKCNSQKLRNSPQRSRNYKHIFSLPPLISFKLDKSLGNFPGRSAFKSDNQPGAFTCKSTRRKICPFISLLTQLRSQHPIGALKSLATSHASP